MRSASDVDPEPPCPDPLLSRERMTEIAMTDPSPVSASNTPEPATRLAQAHAGLQVVLGAGPVGLALVDELRVLGRDVRVVTRSGIADLPEGVEIVAADISDPAQAVRACTDAAVVYGCVGLDYTGWPERWPPMMAGMLAGAEAAGARFVFMDNLYMYGPVDEPMREDMPLTDYGRKPATRAVITRMWQEAHAAGRVRAVAVRASDFYGPRVRNAALGDLSFGRLMAGKAAQVLGDPDQPHSVAYVPDIARALVTLADAADEDYGRAWHTPHAPARTVREMVELFAREVGREAKFQTAPAWLLRLMGIFDANAGEVVEMIYQWRRPFLVDDGTYRARFGGEATPLAEGIAATARWWQVSQVDAS
jgi:nucleoside-diphosphate-sugar epimerase